MSEKKIVKKTKRFLYNRRVRESEAFINPVGIKNAQSVNKSHFFSLRQSLPPLMTERPNATKLVIKLEELKWQETGLDKSFLRMS